MTTTTANDVERFLKTLSKSPSTRATYTTPLNLWATWLAGRDPVRDTAQEWIDELQEDSLADNTVSTYANALRRFLRWKVGQKVHLEAPGVSVGLPKYHAIEKIEAMLDHASHVERVIIGVLYDCAARIGEVLPLKKSEIDWDNQVIEVTRKGGNRERVTMTEKGMSFLRDWLAYREDDTPEVFLPYLTGSEEKAKTQNIRERLKKLAARVGVKNFVPHDLRHSRAVHLLQEGVPLFRVSELLGHRSVEVTAKIYAKLLPEDRREFLKEW